MRRVFKKPFRNLVIIIFLGYLVLVTLISGFYNTIPQIIQYARVLDWFKLGTSIFLTLVIGFLVSVNAVSVYIKYKERKKCKDGLIGTGIGTIGGLAVGVCPLCLTGLFPLIFGFFGVAFSFASLPFGGIEVQILVVIILLLSMKLLEFNSNS